MKQIEDWKFNKNYKVTMHNKLIDSKFSNKKGNSLGYLEQLLIYSAVSNINSLDINLKDLPILKAKVSELLEYIGDGKEKKNHTYFKHIVDNLISKFVSIDNGKYYEAISWFSYAKYNKYEGTFEVQISQEMKPYLVNLENNFTSIRISLLSEMNSKYSYRLYQLLKKWQKLKTWTVEVEELKDLLGVPIKKLVGNKKIFKYERYHNFKVRCLLSAIEDINKHSDIKVDFEEKKEVRSVKWLEFNISSQPSIKPYKNEKKTNNQSYLNEFTEGKYIKDKSKRRYIDSETKEIVSFTEEERAKAVIIVTGINEILENDKELRSASGSIINLGKYYDHVWLGRELSTLVNHIKKSYSIKSPKAFLMAQLKKLETSAINKEYLEVKDLFKLNSQEVTPDFWYDYLKIEEENEKEVNNEILKEMEEMIKNMS